jgi:hypothetical protein
MPGTKKSLRKGGNDSHDADSQAGGTNTELENISHGNDAERVIREDGNSVVGAVRVLFHQAKPSRRQAEKHGHREPEQRKGEQEIQGIKGAAHPSKS